MRKEVVHQLEVSAPADEMWAVIGTFQYKDIVAESLSSFVQSIEVLEGDGGVGTVLNVIFAPGSVPSSYKELFTKVDNEKRQKQTVVSEGGYLDLGYTFYSNNFEIIEKGCDSCIIKSSVIYEIKDGDEDKISAPIDIEVLSTAAQVAATYVLRKRAAEKSKTIGQGKSHNNSN